MVYSYYHIKMSNPNLKQQIRRLSQRATQHLEQLLQIQSLLRGSFHRVYTRCGKPNCWCARRARGHPHARLSWSENGRMTTRKVPAQATQRILELNHHYRQFGALRRQRLVLQEQIEALLDQHEQRLMTQADKPLRSVGFVVKMSPRRRPGRPKAQTRAKRRS